MSFSKGYLSISQRRGLITLLPKKNKPWQYLKNWRPITLLNCDYKIAAKTIAARLKKVLPHLINNDQTGFLKGRFIGENIRLINSVIDYAEKQNIPGLLLFVDFEKAFDTLEWTFVEKTLSFYNFGEAIKSWIKLFYSNITSCIQNNGWSSDFFQLGRGVRQGCPLSPYLFILCVEILANAVRNNDGIKGICISETECKISQYADDTTLILDGTDISAKHSLGLLDSFAEISGLKVNYEKTEALWIGSLRLQNRRIELNKNILWSFCKVNALGVWFSTIKEESAMLNFQEKKEKISKIIENWQFRRLTLLGKITVIKSLLASRLVYILSPLPTPSGYLKEINSLLYKFLWNGKCDKIKRIHMINDYTKGGLKMLDIQSFNNAVKAKWVQRYLDPNNKGKWKLFTDFFLGNHHATALFSGKAWFKRRILHAPNQILILVDSNEYVRLIWFKRRIVLPNKIAEREWRVLNSHSSKHKLYNMISIQFGTCKMRRLNQLSKFSRIFDWISRIFDWLASNWNMSHLRWPNIVLARAFADAI